jgi:sialate O-acetylesterase
MKRIKQVFFLALTLLFSSSACLAKIKLPAIISSHMVLQRNTTVTLWGWSDANEKISVNTSWMKEAVNIVADSRGNWKARIQTTDSKKPQTVRIKSNTSNILVEDILFGEVWLCSGQSNMTMPVNGFYGQPVFGAQQAITEALNVNIRLFTVDQQASLEPQNDLGKYKAWQSATAASVKNFSAVAYFFGKQLQEILDVPVGLIHTSWGGSLIEAWMSNETLSAIQEVDLKNVDLNRGNRFPTVLFNAMINPLIPYTLKGMIWYQGEGNVSRSDQYKLLFPAMVKDWRARWGIGDLPFYFVQIAPFMYDTTNRMEARNNAAFMREVQLKCADLIPNSGIAITMDLGESRNIHPPRKKEVSDRLLYNALNKTYGYKDIDCSGPVYESMEVKNEGMFLSFRNEEGGLYSPGELKGFEIAAEDKVFYPASASIANGNKVFVKSEQVKNPVAVRYAWHSWVIGSLFDNYLLPASSFRTDDWNDARESEKPKQ